jgi:hypothetical protein
MIIPAFDFWPDHGKQMVALPEYQRVRRVEILRFTIAQILPEKPMTLSRTSITGNISLFRNVS